jgi:HK97 gp10 family phage protein
MSIRLVKTGFNFAKLSEKTRQNIAKELNSGAQSAVSLGQQLAPVDTGFMRDNITQIEEADAGSLKSVVESAADYSVFVEYGTVNMEAQPFFTPAFESARRQVNNGLLRVLQ